MKATLGTGSLLLIGMDRTKDEETLVRAYDDSAGVTAAFNLNLLERINRELDGDIPIAEFRHRAIWNDMLARIEMHIEVQSDVRFTVAGQSFAMAAGDTIHTENSHKYGPRDARILLRAGAGPSPRSGPIQTTNSHCYWPKPSRNGPRPKGSPNGYWRDRQ